MVPRRYSSRAVSPAPSEAAISSTARPGEGFRTSRVIPGTERPLNRVMRSPDRMPALNAGLPGLTASTRAPIESVGEWATFVSRVREAFQVDVQLPALFQSPTINAFAAVVENMIGGGANEAPPLVPVDRNEELPLSFAQQRLWFLDHLEQR